MASQRGNVLFLILIAVALFAALSYAVTKSSNSGGAGISKEQAKITASQLVQLSTQIKFTVGRMRLSGVSITDIVMNTGSTTSPCTTGVNCVYASEGGGAIVPSHPDIAVVRHDDTSDNRYIPNLGTASPEIFIVFEVEEDICTAINEGLGLAVPVELDSTTNSAIGDGTSYEGEEVFCEGYNFSSTKFSYVHVLAYQ